MIFFCLFLFVNFNHFNLQHISLAAFILLTIVEPFLVFVKFRCDPRSLKELLLGILHLLCLHVVSLKKILVGVSEAKVKHLFSATLAPMSSKKSILISTVLTVLALCPVPCVKIRRSSASTLGVTPCSCISITHGLNNRATIVMLNGHPCGIEHLSFLGIPIFLPI